MSLSGLLAGLDGLRAACYAASDGFEASPSGNGFDDVAKPARKPTVVRADPADAVARRVAVKRQRQRVRAFPVRHAPALHV